MKQYQAWEKLLDDTTIEILFGGGAGGGKAQPLTAKIVTPNGFTTMGSLKVGDSVCTPKSTSKVIAIYPQGKKDIYEIVFQDGAKTRATADHLWDTWISSKGRRKLRTTEELLKLKSKAITPVGIATFREQSVMVNPYLLGVLLGDGGLTKHLTLTSADEEVIKEIEKRLPKGISIRQRNKIEYSIVCNSRNKKGYPVNYLADKLRSYKLFPIACADRFVPKDYLFNSVKIRTEILAGLLDTDGYVDLRGHISFTSKSKQLALDVQFLVRSLGGRATLKEVQKACNGKIGTYFTVYIRIKNSERFFFLRRKKNRCSVFNGGVSEIGRRIDSIKLVGNEEAQCISIADSRGLYLTDDFIVTHNTWLGAEWLMTNCYRYPGTRWAVGREELKRLRDSTLQTIFKVFQYHKIPREDWNYNAQDHYIDFKNGSRIMLLDLKFLPSDPFYERYGSLELTGAWIEEAGEVHFNAYDTLKSRVGRHRNDEYGVKGKSFITANPKKNWLYSTFYKPAKEGTLPPDKAFIQSLVGDNPYIETQYRKNLVSLRDKVQKQRLLYGNWEYEDDPTGLLTYDTISDLFSNKVSSGDDYLTADIARMGSDSTVVMIWNGLKIKKIYQFKKQLINITTQKINDILQENQIPRSHAIIDEDGIGGGVVDGLKGVRGFVANSRPLEGNYRNLKAQCGYLLAKRINARQMAISETQFEPLIIEELEQLKSKDPDKENKLELMPKDKIKEIIGRSPDFLDNMIMRMHFEINKPVEYIPQLSDEEVKSITSVY